MAFPDNETLGLKSSLYLWCMLMITTHALRLADEDAFQRHLLLSLSLMLNAYS